ncbi:MAG: cell division protein ZapA [Zoogloeaceae bacterium]|jgi:cell division protein ZapA|nr:cell division protein ZapA [Zoogloeaceae bacterium]
MSAHTVDITLHGKEFRIACAPEEKDDLLAVAAFLDWKMEEIAKQTKSSGEKLAVMTALNLAHELINVKEPANTIDASEARRKIDAMEARLDAVLALQEELF